MNFWLCQRNYMGMSDGAPWIETTVPGSTDDQLFSAGGMVNDGGEWVWLTNNPQPICESRARAFESSDPESILWWECDCNICKGI
jgi:hypothetical protein